MISLHIQNAALIYHTKCVFTGIHLELSAGKWVALLGRSGVGKSSLLRTIAGINEPNAHFTGSIYTTPEKEVRHAVAYMAQEDLLLPWLTVLENTLLSIKLNTRPKPQHLAQAKTLLAQVNLSDALDAYPHQLSGGMRQRVALVRTLMQDKPIILMDEAFSALDAITRYHIHQLVVPFLSAKTVLFVTHDPFEALRLADEIYLMQAHGLEKIATLSSEKPRDTHDPQIATLQTHLFSKLTSGVVM